MATLLATENPDAFGDLYVAPGYVASNYTEGQILASVLVSALLNVNELADSINSTAKNVVHAALVSTDESDSAFIRIKIFGHVYWFQACYQNNVIITDYHGMDLISCGASNVVATKHQEQILVNEQT